MRQWVSVGLAIALCVCPGMRTARAEPATASEHRADGSIGDWSGTATMLAGRTTMDRGELIYDDYLYDDYGPKLDRLPNPTPFQSLLSTTNGDYRYPAADDYGYNAADLRQFRVAADDDALHLAVFFQTLKTPGTSIAMVGIDTDGDTATGAAQWPDGAHLRTPGCDVFVTIWGSGARVTTADGRVTAVPHGIELAENVFEADIPWETLGRVADGARLGIVTGLADGDRFQQQQPGATAVFDAGFQGAEEYGKIEPPTGADTSLTALDLWSDRRQSAALGVGDLSAFMHSLNATALRQRRSEPFVLTPGFYNRNFRSRYDYGEGTVGGNGAPTLTRQTEPMFKSGYQPYALYIPEGYDPARPAPVILDLHSFMNNMNQYAALTPNRLRQSGDGNGALVFTPLGRSTNPSAIPDIGILDVLEAWDDLTAHYAVDPDRTAVTGMAEGGLQAYRLGLLMPDRFARAAVHLGPIKDPIYLGPGLPAIARPGLEVLGDTSLLAENEFNLPYELNYSSTAPLVPLVGARALESIYQQAGNPYRFYDNPTLIEPFDVFYHDD